MTFGEYLRCLRKTQGLTAQELGNQIGTTGQYITQMEQGKLKSPNKRMAYKIAEMLGANSAEVWGIAALERHHYWCEKEGIDPDNATTFFQAAKYDQKMADQKLAKLSFEKRKKS